MTYDSRSLVIPLIAVASAVFITLWSSSQRRCPSPTRTHASLSYPLTSSPLLWRAAHNMLYRILLALALLASGSDAYMLAPLRPVAPMRAAVTVMGVKEAVNDCLESGCSIDDVEALIGELKSA